MDFNMMESYVTLVVVVKLEGESTGRKAGEQANKASKVSKERGEVCFFGFRCVGFLFSLSLLRSSGSAL